MVCWLLDQLDIGGDVDVGDMEQISRDIYGGFSMSYM